jgi:hypothetical protein
VHELTRLRAGALALVSAGAIAVGLSGCSSDDAGPAPALSDRQTYTLIVTCMSERGWKVSFNEASGGVEGEYPTAQGELYNSDMAQCMQEADANTQTEYTDEQYRAVYDKLLDTRECLIAEGIELPEPPSFQRFVELKAGWSPYIDVPETVLVERDDLTTVCPQPQIQ